MLKLGTKSMLHQRALRSLAISILGLLTLAGDVAASAFTVTPVRVLLGRNATSALLMVKNDSTEPIRFQITLKAWNQTPSGEMQLSDTKDLLFFPSMMELKPGEQKNVRIGSSFKAPVATERSYRIFFEELPSPNVASTPEEKQASAQVRVLTKMGVPIFVQPPTPVLVGNVANVNVAGGKVAFDVINGGNSFFSIVAAKITGLSTAGPTFEKTQDGWYVLAGGSRHFEFEVPADKCPGTKSVRVEIATTLTDEKGSPTPLTQDLPMPAGACNAAAGK